MDITTITSVVTPEMLETASDMLRLAIMSSDKPPKVIASDIGYSVDMIYSATKGIRSIPTQARQKLSGVNVIAAAAIALEATGFTRLFGYHKVDRHIQSMILRHRTMDRATDKLLDELPVMLLDKECSANLTEGEQKRLKYITCRLIDLSSSIMNLVMELEVKYKLGITPYLQGKEKSPAA